MSTNGYPKMAFKLQSNSNRSMKLVKRRQTTSPQRWGWWPTNENVVFSVSVMQPATQMSE
ncbi:MAG: hypothetical protein CBE00_05780 [Planctomycetaceae bacterium TMED240]|nr:hypothetical protein [Rhodopirellula sp.]OUX07252.1 MAG: hypothetical protein CBE00_05780 [Planctomycetaceae bacterium TMED240]